MTLPIRYAVDLSDRVHHLVHVTLTVPEDLSPGARIVLPVWTPGSYLVRNYVHHVQQISAADASGRVVEVAPDGVTAWRLPDECAGPVEVRLELYANELTVRTNHVDDHHALLIPAATFPYVEGGEWRPHEVTIPAGDHETAYALLPAADRPDTFVAEHRDHLIDSAFEVGDFPVVEFEVAGVPHRFVWSGHGGRPDLDAVARDTRAIAEAAIDLFDGELPTPGYTFLCVGWDQGGGGLEHRDGSVLQMPVRTFHDDDLYPRFQSLVAHEYLHLWNVKRLVPAALVRPDYEHPTHTPSLWVAEGWTAYYDQLLPTRAGVWSLRRLLDQQRDDLARVLDMPGTTLQSLRQASHQAWVKHYVRDENTVNANTDYYAHGGLVAWYLDLLLRGWDPDGDGLDEVLRLLWKRHADGDEGYTEDDVQSAVAEVAARAGGQSAADRIAEVFRRHVDGTELPPFDEAVANVGLRFTDEEGPAVPDLGVIAIDDSHATVLSSVLRDRPAWRAGLTGGDRLVAVDGTTVGAGELQTVLRGYREGDDVEVTVIRGPRLLTRTVTLGEPRPKRRLVALTDSSAEQQAAFRRWTGRPLSDL